MLEIHFCSLFDTGEERYRKLLSAVDNGAVLQVGLCPFIFNESDKYALSNIL